VGQVVAVVVEVTLLVIQEEQVIHLQSVLLKAILVVEADQDQDLLPILLQVVVVALVVQVQIVQTELVVEQEELM
jgi:hypothetical protein